MICLTIKQQSSSFSRYTPHEYPLHLLKRTIIDGIINQKRKLAMGKRKLQRQLSLLQVIMLGTAGTIAAEIFVLIGHAAGIAGPNTVLALIIGGVLTLSIALNYCELATTYPVTGGAMTYVREGFGKNLIMFLVGSFDGLSSTFYAALSAVGFAFSLRVFFPFLPVIPVALAIIVIIGLLHMRGVTQVGNLQIFLGGFLLVAFAAYVIIGLTSNTGFKWETYNSGLVVFQNKSIWANLAHMLTAIALVYNAYVGFEVIADDAEEIKKPSKNIPFAIIASLGITMLVYCLVSFVTIGVIPYNQLAGSETALTDAVQIFWPTYGRPVMALAGIVATLTSVNTAMLSATREVFSLSRENVWPRFFSRLSRWRTPYVSIIFVVILSCLVAVIGAVDLLSFISSAGYMFVLFWASLSMIRLRKMHPNIERPFKVPFFPLTAYLAAGSGVLIIAFANYKALIFLGIVLVVLSIFYLVMKQMRTRAAIREELEKERGGGRILTSAIDPQTAVGLVKLAARLAEPQEDTSICILTVRKIPLNTSPAQVNELIKNLKDAHHELLDITAPIAQVRNVPIYSKLKISHNVESVIYKEINSPNWVRMVLLGYPKSDKKLHMPHNIIKEVLMSAQSDVGVFRDRGLNGLKKIIVPVGTGPNARLALRLAADLASVDGITVTALRLMPPGLDDEKREDHMLHLQEIIEEELGSIPACIIPKAIENSAVVDGILKEVKDGAYDLMIIGAGEEVFSSDFVFGAINDALIDVVPCSTLIVRRYQAETALWLRQRIKRIEE